MLYTCSHVSTSTNVSLAFVYSLISSLVESITTNPNASRSTIGVLPCVTTLSHCLSKKSYLVSKNLA